jgi:adhesin/invasin
MFIKTSSRLLVTLVLLTAVALIVVGGCSSSKKDATPAGSSVNLTASPTTLTQGNTSIVEITVTTGGQGVANQRVTFSVSPSNAGFFTPATDTTDATGAAATVFTATTTGSANITANVNDGALTKTVGVSVSPTAQTGSGNINMSITPTLLLANGSDTASVQITVRDALGQPAPDSTVVKICAGEKFIDRDSNGYWSNGIDSLIFDANNNSKWDGLGLIPSTAYVTGGAGVVTVKYISGSDAMTVYVRATVNDNGIVGYSEVPLQLSPNATVGSIYLQSDTLNLSVKQTGGIESGLIHATCFDNYGNSVPEGIAVSFIITDGPNGGEHLANVGYGPFQSVTNSQGIAAVSIHSGTKSGTIRVRAFVDTVLSNATQVMVSSGPPAHIVVGSEFCNVADWATVGMRVAITAVVSDIYLNPVNDSTVVYFSCDEGTMVAHEERTVEHEGTCTTWWLSGNNVPTADGRVIIRAETSGGTVKDSSFFYNTWVADTVVVGSHPGTLMADGKSKFDMMVSAYDLNFNPLVNGTTVKGSANFVKMVDAALGDGCGSSTAIVTVISSTLDGDYSLTGGNDNGIGAIDMITFRAGLASRSIICSLLTGTTSRANSGINCAGSVDTGKTVDASVSIKDRWGNPLGDHTLVMTASGGTVLGATQETDSYGEAYGFKYRAPAAKGTQTITVTDTDPRGGGVILTFNITVNIPQ